MNTSSSDRHEAVVIGAGQAGLAAGYHLARRSIDFTVLEAGPRVGDVWRDRYDSLLLYSPARYDALPGLSFPLPGDAFPTGRQMADYLEAYADDHRLPIESGVRVDRLRATNEAGGADGYTISSGDRRLRGEPGDRRHRRLPAAVRSRASPAASTQASDSSTRPTIVVRTSSPKVRC